MRLNKLLIGLCILSLTACASAGGMYSDGDSDAHSAMAADASMDMPMQPPEGFVKVSEVTALPEFLPGLGTLYVDPATLPAGPFMAYDRDGTFVSTIYMIPLDMINAHEKFSELNAFGAKTVTVSMYYNAGHPGVAEPHYHIVLWHVWPKNAQLK